MSSKSCTGTSQSPAKPPNAPPGSPIKDLLPLKILVVGDRIRLDQQMCKDVKSMLLQKITRSAAPARFKRVHHNPGGWIEIDCVDDETVKWLTDQKGFYAVCGKFKKHHIGYYPVDNYYPLTVVVPGVNFNVELLKSRLQQQNPVLNVDQWRFVRDKVYHTSLRDDNRKCLFEVDEASYQYLKANDFVLYYQFGTIELEEFDEKPFTESICSRIFLGHSVTKFSMDELRGKLFLKDVVAKVVKKHQKRKHFPD